MPPAGAECSYNYFCCPNTDDCTFTEFAQCDAGLGWTIMAMDIYCNPNADDQGCPDDVPESFSTCRGHAECHYQYFCCEGSVECDFTTTATCEEDGAGGYFWLIMTAAMYCPADPQWLSC